MDYIFHIPTVTPKELEGEDKTSMDVQGVSQTATPEFAIEGTNNNNNNNEKVKITPDFDLSVQACRSNNWKCNQ